MIDDIALIIFIVLVGVVMFFIFFIFSVEQSDWWRYRYQRRAFRKNKYNARYVKALWLQTPYLEGKYYWKTHKCSGWGSIYALVFKPMSQIKEIHDQSIKKYEINSKYDNSLIGQHVGGEVPKNQLRIMSITRKHT